MSYINGGTVPYINETSHSVPNSKTMSSCAAKRTKRVYPYQEKYRELYGLRMTSWNEKTGSVEAVV
jgi:hypothetical protein